MRSKIAFGKLDKLLKPLYALHFKRNIHDLVVVFYQAYKRLVKDSETTKNKAIKVILSIVFFIISIVLFPIFLSLYLVCYILVAALTSLVVTFVVIGQGLYYGLLPFTVKSTYKYSKDIKKYYVKVKHWPDHLRRPIHWSAYVFRYFGVNLFKVSIMPGKKIKDLREDSNTHIIEAISLSFATVISSILYLSVIYVAFQLLLSVLVVVLAIVCGTLWLIIIIPYMFIAKGEDYNSDDDDLELNDEKQTKSKKKKASKVVEPDAQVVTPDVIENNIVDADVDDENK